jgi:hypothetical protein
MLPKPMTVPLGKGSDRGRNTRADAVHKPSEARYLTIMHLFVAESGRTGNQKKTLKVETSLSEHTLIKRPT